MPASGPAWFSVDVEASGPVPGLYSMLALGCCAVREQPDGTLAPGEELYLELKPAFPGVDPAAMRVHGLELERLRQHGREPAAAMRELADFVAAHTPRGRQPVFVGHNAPFDWMMVAYYFCAFEVPNPFGYKALDTKALAMGLFALPWERANKQTLHRLLGLPPEDPSAKHRADCDARYQAQLFCALMRRHAALARQAQRHGSG
ncbi:MAG: hypothetical protein KatS3mg102_1451 [Planctomycetota bacterium]|nr:MAG: hypothetical protein KatS3mg102_1451 [Planctomycetota bacterium]